MSVELEQCKKSIQDLRSKDSHIRYVVDALQKLTGQKVSESTFLCVSEKNYSSSNPTDSILSHEDESIPLAGYIWKDCALGRKGQIFVNNDILSKRGKLSHADLGAALLHELIHAYDDARAIVDPSNCMHQACSEIRAAKLSGECSWSNEWRNFHLNPFVSGMRCVSQHAISSVSKNPSCRGDLAEWAVEAMMAKCYRDYEPFVAPPYSRKHIYGQNSKC